MADQIDQNVARNVKRLREQSGLIQSELVTKLREHGLKDWHPTTLSRTESGDRPVRLSEAHVLARVLGTTIEDLGVNYSPEVRAVEAAEASLQEVARTRSVFVTARSRYVEAWDAFTDSIRAGAEAAEGDQVLGRRIRSAVERAAAVKPSEHDIAEAADDRWEDERERWVDDTLPPSWAAQDGLQGR